MRTGVGGVAVVIVIGLTACQSSAPAWHTLAEFSTSLAGRTAGQVHNARLAARQINHQVVAPDAVWSYNQCVGQWVRSEGYVRAPVSYGGILVPAWGGGVCQTSTTLYNAALLAGLTIEERHPHTIAPSYVAPGLDSAVAQGIADLKLRNPYPFPIRIVSGVSGERLWCRIEAMTTPKKIRQWVPNCSVECEQVAIQSPPRVAGFYPQPGRAGVRVRLWRTCTHNGVRWRELCHETEYQPLPQGLR
ncbi:MAG: VanW family protein [Fimbriimonadales bacterium]